MSIYKLKHFKAHIPLWLGKVRHFVQNLLLKWRHNHGGELGSCLTRGLVS